MIELAPQRLSKTNHSAPSTKNTDAFPFVIVLRLLHFSNPTTRGFTAVLVVIIIRTPQQTRDTQTWRAGVEERRFKNDFSELSFRKFLILHDF